MNEEQRERESQSQIREATETVASVKITFEETGEEREVTAFCRRCKTSRDDFGIVSPGGMAHHSDGYDGTACGMNATGETWWWRL